MSTQWWCGFLPGLLFGWLGLAALTKWLIGNLFTTLSEQVIKSQAEVDRWRLDHDGIQKQLMAKTVLHTDLEQELRSRSTEFDASQGELKAQIVALEPFRTQVLEQSQDLVEVRKQLENAELARLKMEESFNVNVNEFTQIKAKLEEFQVHTKIVDSQGISTQVQQNELTVLQIELADAKKAAERSIMLEDQLAARDTEIATFRNQIIAFDQLSVRASDFEKTIQDAHARAYTIQGERDKASTELLSARQRITELERGTAVQNSEVERELVETRNKLVSAEQNVARWTMLEPQLLNLRSQVTELTPYRERALKLDADVLSLNAQLSKLRFEFEKIRNTPDDLSKIDGIGVIFAKRLNTAGITRFDQLAITSHEKLNEIIAPEDWQKIEFEQWTLEAASFARGQTPAKRVKELNERLAKIIGIGDVYEKRLNDAGIMTYAQLVNASIERLLEITQAQSADEIKLWIAEANAYIQQKPIARNLEVKE